jgi:E3 ubiquitin-protein ligase UBR4
MKKHGAALLGSWANCGGAAPVFPLDFSEKTTCTTADIKLGGDMVRNSDSEGVKLCLETEVGFVEGRSLSGFKVILTCNCYVDD